MNTPPVCDYEGSDYQVSFWERGGREYEDRCEAIALRRLLPKQGRLLLELGAGAGRNTPRYAGFARVVLLDYSLTQLQQAQERLGRSPRYLYVAANIYRLPFVEGIFDAATMIRVLHHLADPQAALQQVQRVLEPNATFLLEFANKRNLKAILRYGLRRQRWNPFTLEAVEFAPLNFNFHPRAVRTWLEQAGFVVERLLTVSHFRVGVLKRLIPARLLAGLDALFQWTGGWWQLTPSVFVRARRTGPALAVPSPSPSEVVSLFRCPACGHAPLQEQGDGLLCPACRQRWPIHNGIYDFRQEKA